MELEKIIADLLGFDEKVLMAINVGDQGDFKAIVTGQTAWLSKTTAQAEVDKICLRLRSTYRLRVR